MVSKSNNISFTTLPSSNTLINRLSNLETPKLHENIYNPTSFQHTIDDKIIIPTVESLTAELEKEKIKTASLLNMYTDCALSINQSEID